MSKILKKELFNIYDIVIFEDKNGITQDCVYSIGNDKEEGKIFEIECNNHVISIHENGSYRVFEKDGKDMPYYATNKKIIHLYTLKNDNRFYEVYPSNDYESVDNAEPSEALECLEYLYCESDDYRSNDRAKDYETIKNYIQKTQEPKKYLKWKDLDFGYGYGTKVLKVRMNDTVYKIFYRFFDNTDEIQLLSEDEKSVYFIFAGKYKDNVQLFNDLHLEVVE